MFSQQRLVQYQQSRLVHNRYIHFSFSLSRRRHSDCITAERKKEKKKTSILIFFHVVLGAHPVLTPALRKFTKNVASNKKKRNAKPLLLRLRLRRSFGLKRIFVLYNFYCTTEQTDSLSETRWNAKPVFGFSRRNASAQGRSQLGGKIKSHCVQNPFSLSGRPAQNQNRRERERALLYKDAVVRYNNTGGRGEKNHEHRKTAQRAFIVEIG